MQYDAQLFHAKLAHGNPTLTIDDVMRRFGVLESPRSPGANAAAQDALARTLQIVARRARSTTPFDGHVHCAVDREPPAAKHDGTRRAAAGTGLDHRFYRQAVAWAGSDSVRRDPVHVRPWHSAVDSRPFPVPHCSTNHPGLTAVPVRLPAEGIVLADAGLVDRLASDVCGQRPGGEHQLASRLRKFTADNDARADFRFTADGAFLLSALSADAPVAQQIIPGASLIRKMIVTDGSDGEGGGQYHTRGTQ